MNLEWIQVSKQKSHILNIELLLLNLKDINLICIIFICTCVEICVLVTKSLNDRLDNSYDQPVTMLDRETNLDRETHIILYSSVLFPMNEEYSE